jgi:6-phosphogluconolactonase
LPHNLGVLRLQAGKLCIMKIVKHYFENEEDLIQKIYVDFKNELQKTNELNQVVALAGGSTPEKLYALFGEENWDNICLTLTDERLLERNHIARNETLLYQTFFKKTPNPDFFSLALSNVNPLKLEESLNTAWINQNKKLHLVLLGMGEDGHIASLFPPQKYIEKDSKIFIETKGPMPFRNRIGLSFKALLDASKIFLFIKGKKKKEILENALLKEDANLPISILLAHATKPIHIYWAA